MPTLEHTHGPSPVTDMSLMLPIESLMSMPSGTHALLTDSMILQTKLHLLVLAGLVLAAILLGRGVVYGAGPGKCVHTRLLHMLTSSLSTQPFVLEPSQVSASGNLLFPCKTRFLKLQTCNRLPPLLYFQHAQMYQSQSAHLSGIYWTSAMYALSASLLFYFSPTRMVPRKS